MHSLCIFLYLCSIKILLKIYCQPALNMSSGIQCVKNSQRARAYRYQTLLCFVFSPPDTEVCKRMEWSNSHEAENYQEKWPAIF